MGILKDLVDRSDSSLSSIISYHAARELMRQVVSKMSESGNEYIPTQKDVSMEKLKKRLNDVLEEESVARFSGKPPLRLVSCELKGRSVINMIESAPKDRDEEHSETYKKLVDEFVGLRIKLIVRFGGDEKKSIICTIKKDDIPHL